MWSIIIFVVGLVSTIVTYFIVIFYSILSISSAGTFASPFGSSLAIVSLVTTIVIGFVYVLFVYELEYQAGRILLWCGYAVNIGLAVTNLVILTSLSPLTIAGLLLLDLLIGIIPAVLFGVAYFLARERIVRGDLPGPMQPLR